MRDDLTRASRFLAFVLRHRPDAIGIRLDEQGWANVEELIAAAARHGETLTLALIREVVETNDKKRYALSEDGQRIRAVQGHSLGGVDLQLQPRTPPPQLFHGTATRFLESIRTHGLRGGSRQHVHLSTDEETALRVGARHGKPVALTINAAAMHAAGRAFYLSENGVWLTDAVPADFIAEMFRDPWTTVLDLPPEHRQGLVDELRREIRPSHPLSGKEVEAIARRQDQDEVLFRFGDPAGYAVVHLSWIGKMEQEGWPHTEVYATLEEFFRLRGDPDAEE